MPATAEFDRRVAEMCDTAEIKALMSRYCRAIDRLDFEIFDEIFDPGATVNLGRFHDGGVADFIDVARAFMGSMERTWHDIANCTVALDGDSAGAETYVTAYHVTHEEGQPHELVVGARYLNRFVRHEAGWRISHHSEVMDWGVRRPYGSWFAASDDMPKGVRDRTDPSYDFL